MKIGFTTLYDLNAVSSVSELKEKIINDEIYCLEISFNNYRHSKKRLNYFIADCVKPARDLFPVSDSFEIEPPITEKNENSLGVKTKVQESYVMGFGLRTPNHNRVSIVHAPAIYYWHELNPKTDIVLNLQLKQIYPYNTGKMPAALKKLFAESNYIPLDVGRMDQSKWNLYKQYTVKK